MISRGGEPRATHRRPKRRYKKRVRMPSKLDPHVALIEVWLAAEPQLTAIAIVGRLAERHPEQFGKKQHSIVQRLLRALRKSVAQRLIIVACVAGWAAIPTSQARVAEAATVQVDTFKMMTSAKKMPSEHFADYSFVF